MGPGAALELVPSGEFWGTDPAGRPVGEVWRGGFNIDRWEPACWGVESIFMPGLDNPGFGALEGC